MNNRYADKSDIEKSIKSGETNQADWNFHILPSMDQYPYLQRDQVPGADSLSAAVTAALADAAEKYNARSDIFDDFTEDLPEGWGDTATKCEDDVPNVDDGGWSKSETGAMRQALGAPYFRQVPLESVAAGAAALEYGAKKYANRNWEKGLPWQQMIDSLKRHVDDLERRSDIDDGPDGSDLHQVCMIMASAMMLSSSIIRGIGTDDRIAAPDDRAFTAKNCSSWMKIQLDGAREIVPKDKRS